jgi:uncharacterized alkaline shock family protein YloU
VNVGYKDGASVDVDVGNEVGIDVKIVVEYEDGV